MGYCIKCGKKMIGNSCVFCGWELNVREDRESQRLKSAVGFINFIKTCVKCYCGCCIAIIILIVIIGML